MTTFQRQPRILTPGDELGGYTVHELVGIGGMGAVYRATEDGTGRTVALKVLDGRLSEQQSFRERFERECEYIGRFDHPNIVPVHGSGESGGRWYLAMEFIEGETLSDRIRRTGLSADESAAVITQIAGALEHAHAVGILHRDVKPHNVLLDADRAYLVDFGVAKGVDSATVTGALFGSVYYASPEQLRGMTLTAAADIYSLASVAYECLTGGVPFRSGSQAAVIHSQLEEPAPALPGRLDEASVVLSDVVRGALAKRPSQRPKSAVAFGAAFHGAVDGLAPELRTAVPAFRAPVRPNTSRRRPKHDDETMDLVDVVPATSDAGRLRRRVAIGLVAVAAVVGGGVAAWPSSGGDRAAAAPEAKAADSQVRERVSAQLAAAERAAPARMRAALAPVVTLRREALPVTPAKRAAAATRAAAVYRKAARALDGESVAGAAEVSRGARAVAQRLTTLAAVAKHPSVSRDAVARRGLIADDARLRAAATDAGLTGLRPVSVRAIRVPSKRKPAVSASTGSSSAVTAGTGSMTASAGRAPSQTSGQASSSTSSAAGGGSATPTKKRTVAPKKSTSDAPITVGPAQ